MMPEQVFVYGNLRKGQRMYGLLKDCSFVGRALCHDHAMLAHSLPYVIPHKGSFVVGEIYEVSEEKLSHLDRAEGHPHLYKRTVIQAKTDDGVSHAAWIYMGNGVARHRGKMIPSGDFEEVSSPFDLGFRHDPATAR